MYAGFIQLHPLPPPAPKLKLSAIAKKICLGQKQYWKTFFFPIAYEARNLLLGMYLASMA